MSGTAKTTANERYAAIQKKDRGFCKSSTPSRRSGLRNLLSCGSCAWRKKRRKRLGNWRSMPCG